jgi:hypothetical protein
MCVGNREDFNAKGPLLPYPVQGRRVMVSGCAGEKMSQEGVRGKTIQVNTSVNKGGYQFSHFMCTIVHGL